MVNKLEEKKEVGKEHEVVEKIVGKNKEQVKESKVEEKKEEVNEGKVEKKKEKKVEVKKELAVVNGFSLRISTKHAIAICRVLRGKSPEVAIKRLEDVLKEKRSIPMSGLEVAHQKGKGLSGAKFPKNACKEIIVLLKQLNANSVINGIEDPIIFIAKANVASRPYKSHGRKAKRTHVYLEARSKIKKVEKK